MRITLSSKVLLTIYSNITAISYVHTETKASVSSQELPSSLELFKEDLAYLIEMDCIIYKKSRTLFSSLYISSFAKERKNEVNIDLTLTGLLLLTSGLESRIGILWEEAESFPNGHSFLVSIFEDIVELEAILDQLKEEIPRIYN